MPRLYGQAYRHFVIAEAENLAVHVGHGKEKQQDIGKQKDERHIQRALLLVLNFCKCRGEYPRVKENQPFYQQK